MAAALTVLAYLDPGSDQSTGPTLLALIALIVLVAAAAVLAYRRATSRPCPRCGHRVRRGDLDCGSCGYDFRAIGR